MKLKALFDTHLHSLLFRFPSLPIQNGLLGERGREQGLIHGKANPPVISDSRVFATVAIEIFERCHCGDVALSSVRT